MTADRRGEGFAYFAWHRLRWAHNKGCRGINDPVTFCGDTWENRR
jgi:hypothetical protein